MTGARRGGEGWLSEVLQIRETFKKKKRLMMSQEWMEGQAVLSKFRWNVGLSSWHCLEDKRALG